MEQYPLFMIQLHLHKKYVPHFIFVMIICESPLLFYRREGWGEQSSLVCKEICSETSCFEQSCFWQGKKGVVFHDHWDHFEKTLKNRHRKIDIQCTLWSTATTKSDLLKNHSEAKYRFRIIIYSLIAMILFLKCCADSSAVATPDKGSKTKGRERERDTVF